MALRTKLNTNDEGETNELDDLDELDAVYVNKLKESSIKQDIEKVTTFLLYLNSNSDLYHKTAHIEKNSRLQIFYLLEFPWQQRHLQ